MSLFHKMVQLLIIKLAYNEKSRPAQKKAQREPHLYSADHAVILGLANTLRATSEHHKMSSIKQGVCEGEVEYYF